MKRREPKLPKGPKPARVNADDLAAGEIKFAERVAAMVLMRLRAEAPDIFAAPSAPKPAPVEGAHA